MIMEKLKTTLTIIMVISCVFMATTYARQVTNNDAKISCEDMNEKIVTLHFYVQNVKSGPNASAFTVASSSITPHSPTKFGQVDVFDDRLTEGPEFESTEVGRVQGVGTSADMQNGAIAQTMNFHLTSGMYTGSTISVVGRNEIGKKQRELSVVGGTGAFRFASGYVITTTHLIENEGDYMVLDYWIHVTFKEY